MPALLAGLGALLIAAAPAQSARIALVIGNDSYTQAKVLKNARADARVMAQALREVGFDDVAVVEDAGRNAMNNALRQFKSRISGGDEVVLYYAGHGVELDGSNLLLPTDVSADSAEQIRDDAVPLQRVLTDLAQRKPKFTMVVLDACRVDPFEGLGRNVATRGLVPTVGARGQVIVYAAGAGQEALDRLGLDDKSPNGLFMRVFAEEMRKPGQTVLETVSVVRERVAKLAESVSREQVPAVYDQSIGRFYFVPPASAENRAASAGAAADGDAAAWRVAESANSAAAYAAYLAAYPAGRFAASARTRIADLAAASPPGARGRDAAPPPATFRDCPECPEMVVLPAGSFDMGSPDYEASRLPDEGPVHRVTVRSFALGRFEVTQGQWRALMGTNPSRFDGCGDECPVEKVSWDDAREYVRRLNEKLTGKRTGPYRLPSESEWEYGCRANARALFCGSDDVDAVAWIRDQSGAKTQRVGSKAPNAFGLHDMSGNVWEWVEDCSNRNYKFAPSDGSAWRNGDCLQRVARGGSWRARSADVRAAFRYWYPSSKREDDIGFRVAKTLP